MSLTRRSAAHRRHSAPSTNLAGAEAAAGLCARGPRIESVFQPTARRPSVRPDRLSEHFSRGTEAIGGGQPIHIGYPPSEWHNVTRRQPSLGSTATAEARLG
jgi:hypothetical protein